MCRSIVFIACAAIFATAPLPAGENLSMADLAILQGKWELPDATATDAAAKRTLEVKGSTFIFRAGHRITRQVVVTLDAAKQPKTMNLKEDGEEQPFLAIYKIDKDRLTLCIGVDKARPTSSRPTRFEAKDGQVLVTYVKVKR